MQLLNRLYIKGYLLSIMHYAFFNKGIAYSYLAEIFLLTGIILIFLNRKNIEIFTEKKQIILLVFTLLVSTSLLTENLLERQMGIFFVAIFGG